MAEHVLPSLSQSFIRPPNQIINQFPKSRNRTGCLTCRQRKKRCDSVRSVCGHCSRLNLVCHWEAPRDLKPQMPALSLSVSRSQINPHAISNTVPTSSILVVPDPLQFLCSDTSEVVQHSLDRKVALRYYIQTFTPMLTTSLENNGFLSGINTAAVFLIPASLACILERTLTELAVLLPMAIEDRPLLDMLIAWSSSHLSLCNDVYHVRALEHRATALKSFASSLSITSQSPEISLAGCLVFCSMSAILGDTTAWHNHLEGAAQIIRSACAATSDHDGLAAISRTYEGRWLLRNFAYHDILMSVTLDREPLIPGQYWIPEPKTTIDSYFGLGSHPMALISKISSLNGDMVKHRRESYCDSSNQSPSSLSDQSDAESPHPPMDSLSSQAYQIESDLQNWICADSTDPYLIKLAETYRSAALIHLYRAIRRHVPEKNS